MYIDVRGVYPSLVYGNVSISLESMIRDLQIPDSQVRSIFPVYAYQYIHQVKLADEIREAKLSAYEQDLVNNAHYFKYDPNKTYNEIH